MTVSRGPLAEYVAEAREIEAQVETIPSEVSPGAAPELRFPQKHTHPEPHLHLDSDRCWCEPELEYSDEYGDVYVHKDFH